VGAKEGERIIVKKPASWAADPRIAILGESSGAGARGLLQLDEQSACEYAIMSRP
jgi:hypothetical protein